MRELIHEAYAMTTVARVVTTPELLLSQVVRAHSRCICGWAWVRRL